MKEVKRSSGWQRQCFNEGFLQCVAGTDLLDQLIWADAVRVTNSTPGGKDRGGSVTKECEWKTVETRAKVTKRVSTYNCGVVQSWGEGGEGGGVKSLDSMQCLDSWEHEPLTPSPAFFRLIDAGACTEVG